eukprot:gnl/TRDRNA2_/TRDRNA2_150416_c0_seq1.p1 gnl/TRDRNA2_/TRDRNA2_150416_c0~~gnl/TRDRNA2_/TRDRNA2_150416_c0_seq1.p1  ORF type:complete len:688 (+),score=136.53 gnl/TRDRNA2_/TRDRNA2_150416_c0_seq1:104-2167(+)
MEGTAGSHDKIKMNSAGGIDAEFWLRLERLLKETMRSALEEARLKESALLQENLNVAQKHHEVFFNSQDLMLPPAPPSDTARGNGVHDSDAIWCKNAVSDVKVAHSPDTRQSSKESTQKENNIEGSGPERTQAQEMSSALPEEGAAKDSGDPAIIRAKSFSGALNAYMPSAKLPSGASKADELHKKTTPLARSLTIWRQDAIDHGANKWTMKALDIAAWWVSLEEPPRTGGVAKLVEGKRFELLSTMVILLNAVFLWYIANDDIDNLEREGLSTFVTIVELLFFMFFFAELILKLFVYRLYFFINEQSRWNILDMVLVAMAGGDQIFALLSVAEDMSTGNLTFVRTLRILKMAKMLRVVRVLHVFQDLRMMMYGIVGSLMSLVWCFVMTGFILYIFSLIFVQAFANKLRSEEALIDEAEHAHIMERFGSVEQSILTLFISTTGGADWEETFTLISSTGSVYAFVFIFYIGFFEFALFNILTALFVEHAMKIATPDRNAMIFEQRRQAIADTQDMIRFCSEMDGDNDGRITLDEIKTCLRSQKARAHLALQGLDVQDAEMFFMLLAAETGTEDVDIVQFAEGAMKMKGTANAMDIQTLMLKQRVTDERQLRFETEMSEKIDKMAKMLLYSSRATCPPMLSSGAAAAGKTASVQPQPPAPRNKGSDQRPEALQAQNWAPRPPGVPEEVS